ncbi:septum formation initiator family protein [Thermocrinis minervae]|uniref:Septum formation initiator n=1 Tax=Thermocrinis minervae TaxID=381751 RepID=A0A1M6QTH3_9AQUI|nr:septum formation initiator family protein [Thermocrinis minervae]SHK23609.1 Septum formation initiator [Thermocrinis minervae]
MSFPGSSSKLLSLLFFLLMLGLTVYNIFFSKLNVFALSKLNKSMQVIDSEIRSLEEDNAKLSKLLQSMENNPDYYRELYTRRYMQMQREGEKFLLLKRE